ncbi:MAG: ABC transporter substrate-binding protein, partial [Acidobacteriota bacterium]
MREAASSHSVDWSRDDPSSALPANLLLRVGLFIMLASLLASLGCRKQSTAVIGFARAGPSMRQIAQEEVRSWKEAAGVEIRFIEISRPDNLPQGLEDDIERASALVKLPDLVAVVGHEDSRASLLTAPIYNEAGIPHIIPTATSRQLKGSGEWTFMLAPDEEAEAAFIALFVSDHLRARAVTVFYQTDEYGTGLRSAIVAALEGRGIRMIDQVSFDWMG